MANYSDIRYEVTGTDVYTAVSDLPLSGIATGTQAFVSGTNRLYMWTGTGWYNIALINTDPSISGANPTYNLNIDGSNTVVTLASTDPEGLPISFTVSHSGLGVGANAIATVTQSNNIFTFTPSTNTALAGTFTSTFTASDGVNVAVANSSFTLAFIVNNSHLTNALITSVGGNNADNNDFVDSSTNSHTITAAGNVTQNTFSPYRHGGYSTYFDGSGDYIRYQDASLAEGTDDFTVEFWVRRDGTQSKNDTVVGHDTTPGYQICFNSDGSTLRFMRDATDASRVLPASLNDQQWHHVVYQRDSGTLQGFLDGVSLGTAAVSTNFTNDKIEIGVNRGGTAYFTGNVRDVRIIKGTAFYSSSGFNVPTEPLTAVSGTGYSTTLLTCHLPYIADGGANSLSPTVNGNTKTEPLAPYDYQGYSSGNRGGSMYFDGTGDYLTSGTSASLALGSGDFTFECWIYPPSASAANYAGIYSNTSDGAGDSNALRFSNLGTDATTLAVQTAASSIFNSTSGAVKVGQWNHCALVRSGTGTNNMTIYVNGLASGSGTSTANFSTGYATIGTNVYLGVHYLYSGHIADVRVVSGTAVYTSAFTPPTAPLTAVTNTSLLLSGTNAGIIDKSQSVKTITLNGDVKSSTTQTKYLSSSMYFDGTGDYITLSDSDAREFGGGDFTIELWVKTTIATQYATLLSRTPTAFGSGMWSILMNTTASGGQVGVYVGDYSTGASLVTTSGASIRDDSWHHVAVVRNGSSFVCYIDGTSRGTGSWAGSITNIAGDIYIGADQNYGRNWQGYMSDLRITKGLARYTANFTPPTAALQG
jgi:hypothetical protein